MKWKKILAVCLFLAAAVLAATAIYQYLREKNAGKEYDSIREEAAIEESAAETTEETPIPEEISESDGSEEDKTDNEALSELPVPTATPTPKPKKEVPIDFDALVQQCPDAYAWIRIPDTNVDYPIVQHPTDNYFYLNHSANRGYAFAGAIYTEDYNSKDFTDPNTLIYGHNMKNGSMFQTLHKFSDKKFFDEHKEFEIYLPDRVLTYRVFAAYVYDDRHILQTYDFSDQETYRLYLREIMNMRSMGANVDTETEVLTDDKIVTLSTCNSNSSQRYLVQGVLLSDS